MTYEELGKALAEARIARGFTLHDVERDTRISTQYLKALEEGALDVLPAPVYARAFMRTYAQYLGLNAPAFVQHLPGARPEPDLPELPDMARQTTVPLLSAGWLISALVVVMLVVMGLLLFWDRGDGTETVTNGGQEIGLGGSDALPGDDQPLPPLVVEPGIVPDLQGHNVLVAINALVEADLPYLIVEIENTEIPASIVYRQSPSPGTEVEQDTVITLLVGR